jgi:3-oxoacyl-(acyl-carrier-protein) synthase
MKNKKLYINGSSSISAQPENAVFEGNINIYHQNIIPAVTPDYKQFITPMALRRMSKGIRMGLTSAKIALKQAGITKPDAIITGTGEGCKQDTEKFLEAIINQDENLLTPTAFIQSTHNTIGGQLAQNLECTGYNVTYTHNSASFESALMDAQLLFLEDWEINSVLVGGVDELSKKMTSFMYLDNQLKEKEISNSDLLKSGSSGTITSEGAHFFSISTDKSEKTYAELIDVSVFQAKTSEDVPEKILKVLQLNNYTIEDIDLVILGNNGDNRFDHFYDHLQKGLFSEKVQLAYKHLTGDYKTVSGYAVWLACKIFKTGSIPEILKLNGLTCQNPKTILLYNQYLGDNHSIMILSFN